ncbi:hypothetical protein [Nocardia asteroides]|uniref:hypothetical protein n=1 Tax=Nocardia asteroides TaxID=1824 RepID=UPI001E328500|nr:hypothetical protein [Nocardia asteroides]UGT62170.1 hypothetical protein LTT61_02120 [Nocardia asteroides]
MVAVDKRRLDCGFDPDHLTPQAVDLILRFHRHCPGPNCLPGIAALAFLSEPASGDDWE